MTKNSITNHSVDVILGNSNSRFSGVTSTMLQVLPYQQKIITISVLGKHHLPAETSTLSFNECIRKLKKPNINGAAFIFHARRNNEMLQAVALKYIFRAKIKIVFTATAQRQPSWITRWLISKADGLLTTSNAAAVYLPRSPDLIIPHGIDSARFHPGSLEKKMAWKALKLPGKFGLGIFGRIRPQKGIDLLVDSMIQIFKNNPNCEASVLVVGETTKKHEQYLKSLKNRIQEAQLSRRFIFLGKQPFEKIPELMRGMSIVTALSRNEGFGLTVLEAMSSGCAVLASNAGAWGDIIKNEFGRLVPADNLGSTVVTLEKLLSLPVNSIDDMGARARLEIEKNYAIEQEAKRLVDFYRFLQSQAK